MKPTPLLVTAGLAAAAVAAGVLLVPRQPELLAMLVRDGRYETAGRFSEAIHDRAEDDPMLLADLFELNSHIGDPHRARKAIEDYLASRPDDMAMLRQAGEFFRSLQDFEAYLDIKERIVAHLKEPADIERLAALYRAHARYDDERRILETYRDRGLSASALGRLGSLFARGGDFAEAAKLLEAALARETDDDGALRLRLFDSLLADGQADRAASLAATWVEAELAPALHAMMVLSLANAGQPQAAERLAATFPRTAGYDPSMLVWAIGEHRRFDLVRQALLPWLEGAEGALLARGAALYVDAARSAGATGQMAADIYTALRQPDAPSARPAMAIAAAAYSRWGYDAIAAARHLMNGHLLRAEPLFAADLSIREANPVAARYFLLQADLAAHDDEQAAEWAELAAQVLSPPEVAGELISRWRDGRLSAAFYPVLQRAAAAAGATSLAFDLFGNAPASDGREAGL